MTFDLAEIITKTPQDSRLRVIEFLLAIEGAVGASEWSVLPELAAADLRLYWDKAPGNMRFDQGRKQYVRADGFKPIFPSTPLRCANIDRVR